MISVVRFCAMRAQFGLYRLFRFRIERGGRFIENQDRRILQDGARDRHALLLAAGQFQAALAHHRVITLRQRFDEIMDVRGLRGGDDFFARRIGTPVGDVVVDRIVEQHGVLRHDADRGAQAGLRHVAYVLAVDQDAPCCTS